MHYSTFQIYEPQYSIALTPKGFRVELPVPIFLLFSVSQGIPVGGSAESLYGRLWVKMRLDPTSENFDAGVTTILVSLLIQRQFDQDKGFKQPPYSPYENYGTVQSGRQFQNWLFSNREEIGPHLFDSTAEPPNEEIFELLEQLDTLCCGLDPWLAADASIRHGLLMRYRGDRLIEEHGSFGLRP